MKKVLPTLLIFASIFFLWPTETSAAGGSCCPRLYNYSASENKCVSIGLPLPGMQIKLDPIYCPSGESCKPSTGNCQPGLNNNTGPQWSFDNIKSDCLGGKGIATAIGCIPTDDNLTGFVGFILKFVFGAAGGLILVMLIITGYNILTSGGNPEKLQASKENLISIFSGIILIGFSLVLLKAIGFNILGLPGF